VRSFTKRTIQPTVDKVLNKLIGRKKNYLLEGPQQFHAHVYNATDNVFLDGYWQSPKYFQSIDDVIRKEFIVKEPMTPLAQELLDEISNTNSVCVNVRRGDFVINPSHDTVTSEYYPTAEKIILQKNENVHFYVFSDEVEWCQKNLKFSAPTTFVTHAFAGKKFQDYLRLMSGCKNFIIPNSSFAWWAAYLNNNRNKIVVAPKKWMNKPDFSVDDLLPPDWIRI
jgi:hypothetical protein